jgi:hypothetical protein
MMKVVDCDFLEQIAVHGGDFATLFGSIWTHIPDAIAEAFSN